MIETSGEPPIVVVGINQQTAPLALRERLAISSATLPEALAGLGGLAAEGLILSTCNRVELYALLPAGGGVAPLVQLLVARGGGPAAAAAPHVFVHRGAGAVRHLCAVAAGLDSLVLGEDQILAQVRAALAAARRAGTLGPVLARLGQMALATGKQVRAGTAIGRSHLSVVSVALALARDHLGDLGSRTVLVVGAGHTAELALKHLSKHPPARVLVANRTAARAAGLAARYGATAWLWDALGDALAATDLVISCTSAPEPVLDASMVAAALAARPARPLLLLDLAVPRDVAPTAGAVPDVTLYDVDSLEGICAANREQRAGEIAGAEGLVDRATAQFLTWWQARARVPAITALRAHAEAIRDAEVARVLARLPDLEPAERAAVAYLAEALVNKLLHTPTAVLRTAPAGADLAAAAHQLFGLPADPP